MPYGSSGDVYVLADKYGRVLVQHVEDGDYYQAVVWSDTRIDWDSHADPGLVTQMINHGYVEGLTIAENLDVTVNIDGETETYVWDAAKAEFDHDFDVWKNGTRNLTTKWFAKEDGTPELVVVDETTERPVSFNGSDGQARCMIVLYPTEPKEAVSEDLTSQHPELAAVEGGFYAIDYFHSPAPDGSMGTDTFVNESPEGNNFVMNLDEDGLYRDGTPRLPIPPAPVPIAIEGAVQVFADQLCSHYADGSEQDVYIRVNRRFGYGDYKVWGSYETSGSYLRIDTPTESEPELTYSIELWIDYHSGDIAGPIEAGTIIRCNAEQPGVNSPQVIFYDE